MVPTSATRIGASGPKRSASRPTARLFAASSTPATSQVAPIATALKPSCDSRSGPSTDSVPNRSAGRTTNHTASRTRRSRSAWASVLSGFGSSGPLAGVASAHAARPSDAAATAPKVQPVPAKDATPPSTGPSSAPATAAANAWPISCPRLPEGALATSQASAPVHEKEPASPWQKRARSSSQDDCASPTPAVVAATKVSPTSTVGLTPSRAATIPLGIAPASAPSG